MLCLVSKGAAGGAIGACVLVNPAIAIIETGGTLVFCSLVR